MKTKLLFTILLNVFALVLKSQSDSKLTCATDYLHSNLYSNNTTYKAKFDKEAADWQTWALQQDAKISKSIGVSSVQSFQDETLPVVFHKMVNGVATPITNALSKPDFVNAIAMLNQIYGGLAAGTKPAGINTHIQFCLAEVDANNQAITNYTYTNPLTSALNSTSLTLITQLSNVVQNTLKFPTTKYINVYLVEDIVTYAGFAYLPSAHGLSYDGIYIESQYISAGSTNNMNVLTHEMGHYLGLLHTFGLCDAPNLSNQCSCNNNNCLYDGDMVCDTPPDYSQAAMACTNTMNTCTTDVASIGDNLNLTADVNDLIDNYMDYGNQNCQYLFTAGQIKRMHFMIDASIGPRNSLLNSSVCNPVCATNCTTTINPITTATISGVPLANTIILTAASVNYTFTANTCNSIYDAIEWTAINLNSQTVIQTATITNFAVTFNTVGNYRVLLKTYGTGSNPLCYQIDTLNFQVLPMPNCPPNLDMSAGWNAGNWQRIQYEGGWARNTNYGTFTFPTTTMTIVPPTDPNGTLNTDPFSFVNTLSADPNFSSLSLPAGISTAMRVGKLITPTTTLTPGDASYVTYTYTPTKENSKLRIYYLGIAELESGITQAITENSFAGLNISQPNSFGFISNYQFTNLSGSITNSGLTHQGKALGSTSSNIPQSNIFNFYVGGPAFNTMQVNIGAFLYRKMLTWEYRDIDFSELTCSPSTVTITFYARSDNPSNLGFNHAYSYYAIQCLPAEHKYLDMNLANVDFNCNQTCATVSLPNYLITGGASVKTEESFDGITFTNPIQQPSSSTINLCKTPDDNPYKSFKITYKTLCQTLIDTVTVFQRFVHPLVCTPTNTVLGGNFFNQSVFPATVSPDKYIQLGCNDTIVLKLTRSCLIDSTMPEPEYQWGTKDVNGTFLPFINDSASTSSTYTINGNQIYMCTPILRATKYIDPYCGTPTWVYSDVFNVTSFKNLAKIYYVVSPNICGNEPIRVKLNNIHENVPNCDPELMAQLSASSTTNTLTLSFFSWASCTPSSSLTATSGPSVYTFTFTNYLDLAHKIDTAFTFNNPGIYNAPGGNVYVKQTITHFGCVSSSIANLTNITIKPSAVAGTIIPQSTICANTTFSIAGNNTNINGYSWEYSYNNMFNPTNIISASNTASLYVTPSFTSYPVYFRRIAFGNSDCPNSAFSNTVVINDSVPSINSTIANYSLCAGNSVTLAVNGADTYTWQPGAILTNSIVSSPIANIIYTVTGKTNYGCSQTIQIPVNVFSAPTLTTTTSSSSICTSQSATLQVTGADNYTWMPGNINSNEAVVTPTSTSIYTVTGSNIEGCVSSKQITIDVFAAPNLSVGSTTNSICLGESIQLTANGANSYLWNTNNNTNSITVSPTTNTVYSVVGTSTAGCIQTDSINITVLNLPNISVNSASVCNGQTTVLNASGATTYTWSPGINTSAISVNPNSTSIYTVTGSIGTCTSSSTSTITVYPEPTLNLTASSASICIGQSSTLNVSGAYTYTWSNGFIGNSQTINPTNTTTYSVLGESIYGCINTTPILITVNTLPTPILSVPNNTICAGQTTTLTATGALSYTWSTTETTADINVTPLVTTNYNVTGSNGFCENNYTATVFVNLPPNVSVATSYSSGCIPASNCIEFQNTNLNTNTLISYSFGDGTTSSTNNPTHCYTSIGSYTVIAIINDLTTGCNANYTLPTPITISNSVTAMFTIPEGTVVTLGTPITLINNSVNATSYNWDVCNVLKSSTQHISVPSLDTGICCINLKVENGSCSDETTKCIKIVGEVSITIPNVFTPNSDGKNDIFKIKTSGVKTLSCIIYDRWGLKMHEWIDDINGFWNGKAPNDIHASDGTYFFVITYTDFKDKTKTEKGFLTMFRD